MHIARLNDYILRKVRLFRPLFCMLHTIHYYWLLVMAILCKGQALLAGWLTQRTPKCRTNEPTTRRAPSPTFFHAHTLACCLAPESLLALTLLIGIGNTLHLKPEASPSPSPKAGPRPRRAHLPPTIMLPCPCPPHVHTQYYNLTQAPARPSSAIWPSHLHPAEDKFTLTGQPSQDTAYTARSGSHQQGTHSG